jgi:hypothetical protein
VLGGAEVIRRYRSHDICRAMRNGLRRDGTVNAGRAAEFGRHHFDKPAFAVARIARHTAVAPEIDKRLPSLGGVADRCLGNCHPVRPGVRQARSCRSRRPIARAVETCRSSLAFGPSHPRRLDRCGDLSVLRCQSVRTRRNCNKTRPAPYADPSVPIFYRGIRADSAPSCYAVSDRGRQVRISADAIGLDRSLTIESMRSHGAMILTTVSSEGGATRVLIDVSEDRNYISIHRTGSPSRDILVRCTSPDPVAPSVAVDGSQGATKVDHPEEPAREHRASHEGNTPILAEKYRPDGIKGDTDVEHDR